MTPERKPVAFGDMRNWMKALKSAGELREIDAEVRPYRERNGTRLAQVTRPLARAWCQNRRRKAA